MTSVGTSTDAAGTGHVLTHCPYCSLQCGMRMRPAGQRPPSSRSRRLSHQPRRPVLEGLDRGGAARPPRPAHHAAGPRRSRGPPARCAPPSWDEALDRIVTAIRRSAGRPRATTASAASAAAGSPTKRRTSSASSPGSRCARRTIDYNGRFCMSSAATAGQPSVRRRPRPAVPARRHRRSTDVSCWWAATRPTPCRRRCSTSTPGRGQRRARTSSSTRGARATARRRRRCTCSPRPGTDLALANGLLHIAIARRADRRGLHRRAHHRVRCGRAARCAYWPDRVERITGVPVGAAARGRARCWPSAEPAMILTARGAEQHSNGTDTAQAYINLALALGLPGRPCSGYGTRHRPGQRAGRARARPEGRPAARATAHRRPGRPGARRRGVGHRPGELPRPGRVRVRDARPAGHRRRRARAAGAGLQHRRLGAGRRTGSPDRLGALDFLAVSDIFLSETAALADVVLPDRAVGRGGGHDDQPGGPGDPAPTRRCRRPAASATTCRCWRSWPSGWAAAQYFSRRPADGLRRAAAGQRRRHRRLRRHQLRADRRPSRACSGPARPPDHPGTPRLFADARSPRRTGGPASSRSSHRPAAEEPDAEYPLLPDHRPAAAQYQCGTQTRRVAALAELAPGAARRDAPATWPARLGIAAGDVVELAHPPRPRPSPRATSTDTIRPDTVFAPFHWGGGVQRQRADQPGAGPALADAGVQGLRRRGRARRRAEAPLTRRPSSPSRPSRPSSTAIDHARRPDEAAQPPFPAGRIRVRGARASTSRSRSTAALQLHRPGRHGRPGGVLPRRQLPPTSWSAWC